MDNKKPNINDKLDNKKTSLNDKLINIIICSGMIIMIFAIVVYTLTWKNRSSIVNIIFLVCIISSSLINIYTLSKEKDKK